ncbi:hypothetical protein [Pedobacter jamesrossensis]|uniref:Uncharacterized protein n=1 Tax=Pedobacter jamesrossensis TaxID=1908238 RepID=A0ABV8NJX4_9SPHI
MKRKNKPKSKGASKNKQLKKELVNKLTIAFNEIVTGFGKAKKADKVIEKFTKQLAKKITFSSLEASETSAPKVEESTSAASKEKTTKAAVKKTKAPVKEVAE